MGAERVKRMELSVVGGLVWVLFKWERTGGSRGR